MAITSIDRDYGVSPSIVRLTTTDNYATITASGYLTAQEVNIFNINGGAFGFIASDLVCCYYNNGHAFFSLSADFSTLVELGSSSLTIEGTLHQINATVAGHFVVLSFPNDLIFPGNPSSINPMTINGVTVGQGGFEDGIVSNTEVGLDALISNASGVYDTCIGFGAGSSIISSSYNCYFGALSAGSNDGNYNVIIGYNGASSLGVTSNGSDNTIIGAFSGNGGGNVSGSDMLGGDSNTWIGKFVTGSDVSTSGTIGIGKFATPDPSTGSTSGTFGPGIAIGSSSFPVGFRGDGTAIPAGSQHYWRVKVNDTYYDIPLITDAAALLWPASGTLATTSQLPNQSVNTNATPTFVSIKTAPAVSSASTVVVGTAYQNTLGYDVVLIAYLDISSAAGGSISCGVGSTNAPTQQTIVAAITTVSDIFIPVTVYLPNNYYVKISTTGTISLTVSGQQVTPV